MKPMTMLFLVMIISLGIAFFWDSLPLMSQSVHYALDPTAGELLNYNINWGMIIITAIVTLFITLVQKYTVDNDTLRELKKEQKILQKEMKNFKEHPEKLMELQKKQLEFIPQTFQLTMRPLIYTAIPIILFFRWFNDYFDALEVPVKIFGFFSWFWAYLVFAIIFSILFRKLFKLP
jgi:uncharacterized membrane protein (DUF106 family)